MENKTRKPERWPKAGSSAADILNTYNNVLLDASLMDNIAFQRFYSEWVMNSYGSGKCIYIQTLIGDGVMIPNGWNGIKALQAREFQEYPSMLKQIGSNWIFLTKSESRAEIMRKSVLYSGIYLRVYGLDGEGKVEDYKPAASAVRPKVSPRKEEITNAFELTDTISPMKRVIFRSSHVPVENSVVYDSDNHEILLGNEFSSNPQSITYQTNRPGTQAKIYEKEWLQFSYFRDKAERMVENPLEMEGICWPTDVLHNANGEFVGILVPKAEGLQLKQNLMSQAGLETNFPNWNRKNLTHMVRTILEKIVYLQKRNVIFGLLNSATIFVKDENHVYFTDLDTYQIEGYPILACERVMQAPELQDSVKGLQLYIKQQDNYEIALLTFMTLMPGKFPYNKGKYKNISDSIREMQFAFRYGEKQGNEHGAHEFFGLWRFVWSHLGNDLKKAFYFTFQKGQRFSLPEKRKYATYWLGLVRNLEEELENPYDKESLRMFPRTFKRYSGTRTIRCSKCGIEHPTFYYRYPERKICNSCMGQPSDQSFVCRSCGKTYYYDFSTLFKYEDLVRKKEFKMPTHCPYCRSDKEKCKGPCGKMVPTYRLNKDGMCPDCAEAARKQIVKSYKCKGCSNMIELSRGQVEYFEKKALNLPVWCDDCKNKRRMRY